MEFVSFLNLFLSSSQREKISSIYFLYSFGLVSLCCISDVLILAIKILKNETTILVDMAVLFVYDETKYFSKKVCWDRWVIVMQQIVCLA